MHLQSDACQARGTACHATLAGAESSAAIRNDETNFAWNSQTTLVRNALRRRPSKTIVLAFFCIFGYLYSNCSKQAEVGVYGVWMAYLALCQGNGVKLAGV